MLLTIRTTHTPATDLGYLLHKNPARVQSFDLTFGRAHVFYPEATEHGCTAALLLDVDPVGLVRGKAGGEGRTLAQYVNDRPYVASSFLSVAIAEVFGTAMGGSCKTRPDLLEVVWPLEVGLEVVPSAGGAEMLGRLFAPLGYEVETRQHPLDLRFPEWGESPYFSVRLKHALRLADLLSHLYVLIPTLDATKHYYIADDEVEKLVRKGEGWLTSHPEKETIVRRYLKRRPSLIREALAQLVPDEESEEATSGSGGESATEPAEMVERVERKVSLHEQRLGSVLAAIKQSGAKRVLDLGCGEGKLLGMLLKERQFTYLLGMDVSYRALEIAQDRLYLDRMPSMQRARIDLIHGSLIYRDRRLEGYDAAAVVEVIEHLDPPRLAAFARSLFGYARPSIAVITTPNREYNAKFETLPEGKMRHRDHRFEWTRAEFQTWADAVGTRFGYSCRFLPIGPEDPELGAPSQMAVMERNDLLGGAPPRPDSGEPMR